MKLKDCQELWGIPIVHLKEHSKKYRIYSFLLYFLDIVLMFGLTAFMYTRGVDYNTYGFVLVSVCIMFHFIIYSKLNPEKWEAFQFYKKHINCEVKEVTYEVDENKLYSVLYCTGYKRLKQNGTIDNYKELILSACCENIKYAPSIMKYIKKYESKSGNLTCIIIQKGKKQYFIDFKQIGENDDGIDFEGEITESERGSVD